MRARAAVVLLLIILLIVPGLRAYGESVAKPGILFSVPFNCGTEERNEYCLADSFKAALNVVLVSDRSICTAKTADAFTYQYVEDIEATHLAGLGECSPATKNTRLLGHIRYRNHPGRSCGGRHAAPIEETFVTSKDAELKARVVPKPQHRAMLLRAKRAPQLLFPILLLRRSE